MRALRGFSPIVLLLGLVGGACGDSATEVSVEPESAPGLSTEEAGALAERFQSELDRLYRAAQETEENFPGGIAAYMLPDGRIFSFATGYSDVEEEIAMTTDLRMPSGSIGKTYAAAVGIELAQQGRLDLDQPISDWLGEEEWFSRVPNGEDLTLRILLSHGGGLIDHAFDAPGFREWAMATRVEGNRDAYLTPREVMTFALDREPLFAAGEGYNYTDTGYILAGIAMEEATGASYYDLLRELFLEPFEFEYTLPADRRDLPDLAQGYAHESSVFFGTPLEIVEDGEMVINPLGEWTGGGLVNNPQDLVRWAKLLYEGEAITGNDLPDLLEIGFVSDPEQPEVGYGLGVFKRMTDHGLSYGHGGFYPGYNSAVAYYPEYEVAVALQINSDKSAARDHSVTLAALVLDAIGPLEESP